MEDLCERIERAALLRAVRILAARAHPAAHDAGTVFLAEYCAEDAALLQLLRADAGASDDAVGWILDAAQRLAGSGTSASEHVAPHEPAHLEREKKVVLSEIEGGLSDPQSDRSGGDALSVSRRRPR